MMRQVNAGPFIESLFTFIIYEYCCMFSLQFYDDHNSPNNFNNLGKFHLKLSIHFESRKV